MGIPDTAKTTKTSRRPWTSAGRISATIALLGVLLVLGLAGPAAARTWLERQLGIDLWSRDGTAAEETPTDGEGLPYTVEIRGVDDPALRTLLERSSQLVALEGRPPATLAGLGRRIETDVDRFQAALRSEGYWDGTIDDEVDETSAPIAVVITVTPGPVYRLSSFDIRYETGAAAPKPDLATLGVVLGSAARGSDIVDAEARLLVFLRNNAHALARFVDRDVLVDHDDQTVQVEVIVDPGPATRFGPTAVDGLNRTNERFVRQWVTWREGEPFDQSQLDRARAALGRTGLFASVSARTPDSVDADGALPVFITVDEAKPRSIGGGIGYSTDRGVAGRIFWRHRNLFGNAEDLEISANADFLQQYGRIDFQRPHFGASDRSLFAIGEFVNSDTDAFSGIEAFASSGLIWPIAERWRASIGGKVEFSDLSDVIGPRKSTVFGVPLWVRYGEQFRTILDQSEGIRFELAATPYVGKTSKALTFLASDVTLVGYQPLTSSKRFIAAGRVRVGSLAGEQTFDIPANLRIYAGGAGSVRGYGFQKIGPVDAAGNPVGGRSKIEIGAEIRTRVWGDFSLVPFVDAGAVYPTTYPDFSEQMRWAAGLGLRYDTGVGPLRLDVGVPINRIPSRDDPFQLYISFGQAF